jgi:hypothetical protein
MSEQQEPPTERVIGRRRLLRRAGGVAAGVAGATVVAGIAAPSPAAAAAGGNLVLGAANDAGTAKTGLTASSQSESTLELSNTAAPVTVVINSTNVDQFGAQLRLVPQPKGPNNFFEMAEGEPVGSLGVLPDGTLWTMKDANSGGADMVYTSFLANMTVPITPTRVIDTRDSLNGRTNIIDASTNLDSQGRLIAGHTMNVDLGGLVFAATAVYANLTIVAPQGAGNAALLPGGSTGVPPTSNVNYVAGQTTPNFAVVSVHSALGLNDVVSIYSYNTAHVILDVFAFTVNFAGQVNSNLLPPPSGATAKAQQNPLSRAELARTGKPTWSK